MPSVYFNPIKILWPSDIFIALASPLCITFKFVAVDTETAVSPAAHLPK